MIKNLFSHTWYSFFIIVFLIIGIYGKSLFFGITYSDDNVLIVRDQPFLQDISNIFQAFKEDDFRSTQGGVYYRPIVKSSLILDTQWQFKKYPLLTYHFSNILLHLSVCLLLFIFLKELKFKKNLVFWGTIIFAIHPLNVQSVAWITGRVDSILAFFSLLTFIFLIKWEKTKKNKWFLCYLISFMSALFSKENAVILPILHLFYLVNFSQKNSLKPIFKKLFLTWIIVLPFWFFIRKLALLPIVKIFKTSGIFTKQNIFSLFENSPALIPHLGKFFFPFNLSPYSILENMTFFYGIISFLLLFLGIFIFRKKIRFHFILLGFGIFFSFLILTFINPNNEEVKVFLENRMYLPNIGLLIIFLELLSSFKFKKQFIKIFLSSICILFSFLTIRYIPSFKNGISYWEKSISEAPNSAFSHNNLGAMYYLNEKIKDAEKEWKTSLKINPNQKMVHMNLGLIYMNTKRTKEAEKLFLKEIEINPYYSEVYYNLGLLYLKTNKETEALSIWNKLLSFNPRHLATYQQLNNFYHQKGNLKKEKQILEQIQKIK